MPPTEPADRDRFVAFSFAAADLLVQADPEGNIQFATGAIGQVAGVDAADPRSLFELVVPQDREVVQELLKDMGPESRRGPILVVVAGSAQPALLSILRPGSAATHFATFAAIGAPILHSLAGNRDPETGLPTPEAFKQVALQRLVAAQATDTLMELSILHMGEQTDELDAVERQAMVTRLAAMLRAFTRGSESIAGLGDGGMAVLHDAGREAERLARRVEAFNHEQPALAIKRHTISIDSTKLTPEQASEAISEVLDGLEGESCSGSQGTRCRPTNLETCLDCKLKKMAARVAEAKRIIATSDFRMVFQPIIDLATRKTHHYEALARLPDDSSTFDFVTLAERIGFIADFDLQATKNVIDKVRAAVSSGFVPQVAINLSARSIQDSGFVERLFALHDEAANIAHLLMFEITESYSLVDLEQANQTIQRLRARGSEVCLDDFGSGSAAYQYLSTLDVDCVKLDGVFIRNIVERKRDRLVLKSMADLARGMNVATIAEMVETEEQAEILRSLGIQFGQGFLFNSEFKDLVTAEQSSNERVWAFYSRDRCA